MSTEETLEHQQEDKTEESGYDLTPKRDVVTAFVVVIEEDGNAVATNEINILEEIRLSRIAQMTDMWTGASQVAKDIEVHQTATLTAQMMMQVSQIAAKQMQDAKLAAALNKNQKGFDPRLLRK